MTELPNDTFLRTFPCH